jgi:predicted Ser/Thr protein kinase/roadblock/LC7 domain-containing protein
MDITAGATVGPYKIMADLGKGGMGEVYLAEDTRLRRKVALKLLPSEFTRDAARVRRFEQEARAASALNHPNIITIHEIGEANGAHYIATEFIDGQTLRQRLKEKLTINAALDIAIQIAAALAAAHEAGITHRDIKPENVMLRRDGIVKVLDFGLAKLTEQRPDAVDSEAPTIAKVNTDPGTVMGTASYTTFSPDGNFVYYRAQEKDGQSTLYQIPALGGASKKILMNIRGAISFSPDGQQFAFMRRRDLERGSPGPLVVVNADGSSGRVLVSHKEQSRLAVIAGPSWSPDGGLIAFAGALNESGTNQTVMGVAVKTGEIKPLTAQQWEIVSRVAWFSDGSGLAFGRASRVPRTHKFFGFPFRAAKRSA